MLKLKDEGEEMKINCSKPIITRDEAMNIAKGGGNIAGRMLYGNKDIDLKLLYLENRYIVYNMTYLPNPISKLLKKTGKVRTQKIAAIIDGTRCTASYVPDELRYEELIVDEELIQYTEFSDEELISKGKDMCRRMVRRQMGRYITMEVESMISVYRPYYIAFYGSLVEGTKVRYLPIAADGNEVKRAF